MTVEQVVPIVVALIAGFISLFSLYLTHQHDTKLLLVQHQLDRQSHASKLTFEEEYKLLQELWHCLVELRQASDRMVWVDAFPDDSNEDAVKDEFSRCSAKLCDLVEKNRPFYAPAIYKAFEEMTKLAWERETLYQSRDPKVLLSPYKAKNRQEINKGITSICDEIRKRLFSETSGI
jgi:hypothetical protein